MKITKEDVKYTAKLAKLTFDDEQIEKLAQDMSNILDYAEKINEVDTENVQPMTHVLEVQNVLREDENEQCLDIEDVLKNAPDRDERTFRVPKVL